MGWRAQSFAQPIFSPSPCSQDTRDDWRGYLHLTWWFLSSIVCQVLLALWTGSATHHWSGLGSKVLLLKQAVRHVSGRVHSGKGERALLDVLWFSLLWDSKHFLWACHDPDLCQGISVFVCIPHLEIPVTVKLEKPWGLRAECWVALLLSTYLWKKRDPCLLPGNAAVALGVVSVCDSPGNFYVLPKSCVFPLCHRVLKLGFRELFFTPSWWESICCISS